MRAWGSVVAVICVALGWTAACGGDDDGGGSGGASSGGVTSGGSGGATSGGSGGVTSGGGSGGTTSGGGGSGGSSGDAGKCGPNAPPTGWQPPTYGPAKTNLGSCTTGMISEYFAKCMKYNEAPCTEFGASSDAAKAKCEGCLWSKGSDTNWSAFVTYSKDWALVNAPGCVELLGGENAADCAVAISDSEQCLHEACKGCGKPGTPDQKCLQAAAAGVCKIYAEKVNSKCTGFGSSYCLKGDIPSAEKVAAAFCGPAVSDGGTDAGGDAATDGSKD